MRSGREFLVLNGATYVKIEGLVILDRDDERGDKFLERVLGEIDGKVKIKPYLIALRNSDFDLLNFWVKR